MNDDSDDMNCCSEYFYIRYAGEDTLIGEYLYFPTADSSKINENYI
jgi:hypothetical protein